MTTHEYCENVAFKMNAGGVFNSARVRMDSEDMKKEMAPSVPSLSPERSAIVTQTQSTARTEVPLRGLPSSFRVLARHARCVKSEKSSDDVKAE